MAFVYGVLFLLVALLVGSVVRAFGSTVIDAQVLRVQSAYRLPVRGEVQAFVTRRTASRHRAIRIGQLAGVAVAIAIGALIHATVTNWVWIVIAGSILGWMTALCVSGLRELNRASPGGIARAVAVGIDDYLAPLHHALAGVAIACGIVVVWASTRLHGFDLATWSALALAFATFALAEFASRRLVTRPQPAGTDLELAWSDALRAQLVRDFYSAPVGFAMGAAVLGLRSILGQNLVDSMFPYLTLAFVISGAIAALIAQRLGLELYVLRRLWPSQLKSGWY